MADSNVVITSGSGTNIDTRTETTNLNHRQVIVLGDPAINANVAAVLSQDVGGSDQTTYGVAMRLAGSAAVQIVGASGSISTYLSGTAGTVWVKTDPDATVGGIRTSINVYLGGTAGTIAANIGKIDGTVAVFFSPAAPAIGSITSSISTHILSTGGTIHVKTDPSSVISGILSSINVYLGSTAGTIGVRVGQVDGVVLTNSQHTASIFTTSGSTSGGTTSGVTLVSPSANYNFKVFAYSIQTTGAVSNAWRFTNGAGSETELWRPLVSSSAAVGANLAITPPGYIFATGVNVTLALKSDSGSLIHYSVAYIKESA